jgi:hypothetical protein
MFGLKTVELVFVFLIVAIAATSLYARNSMERMPVDESGPNRLTICTLLILVSSIFLWNLVKHVPH